MAARVEHARDQVAGLLPSGGRVVFTSGATEAINLAIKGSMAANAVIAVSAIEHAAVLDTADWLAGQGARVIRLPVTPDGLIDVDAAGQLLPDRIDLLAVMQVNNEVGRRDRHDRPGLSPHGEHLGPAGEARRGEADPVDPWRRTGTGPAFGHLVACFVRRLRRCSDAGG